MAMDVIGQFAAKHALTLGRSSDGDASWNDGSATPALLAILWHLEPMISNGGWPAVFYNRVGWAVPLAARGYTLLGMTECAERCQFAQRLVEAAEAANPVSDHESDEWLGGTLMQAVGDEHWNKLDDGWMELTASTHDAMANYLLANALA